MQCWTNNGAQVYSGECYSNIRPPGLLFLLYSKHTFQIIYADSANEWHVSSSGMTHEMIRYRYFKISSALETQTGTILLIKKIFQILHPRCTAPTCTESSWAIIYLSPCCLKPAFKDTIWKRDRKIWNSLFIPHVQRIFSELCKSACLPAWVLGQRSSWRRRSKMRKPQVDI